MSSSARRWWIATIAIVVSGLAVAASIAVRLEANPSSSAAPPPAADPAEPLTGALLVDLADAADAGDRSRVGEALARAIAPVRWPSGPGALGERLSEAAQLFRLAPPRSEVHDVLEALADDPDVEGVERERVWSLPDESLEGAALGETRPTGPEPARGRQPFTPNDPFYKHQWHLDQVQMPAAWNRARGDGVVVAVIDTGVLYRDDGRFRRAPDLARTRFVSGHDFVDNDAFPDDEQGHGTHVAGTVAQSTNNAVGVAGVAPEVAIMPVRVLDRNGAGRWGNVAAGIRWAADHGADVINLSLGGGIPSQTIRRAVRYAHDKGVVVVAAAGNTGRARVGYPAAHEGVIAVGAVRFDETLTFYSAHGRGLALVAPGGDLRVDQNGDGLPDGVLQNTMVRRDPARHDYVALMGTSMATPHVAGAAALVRGAGVRDPDTVEGILRRSAKDRGNRRLYGAGLLQVDDALALAHRGLGGTRLAATLLLGVLALAGLRRRGRLAVSPAASVLVGGVVAGGLAFVPGLGVPGMTGMPGWLASAAGALASPLVLSAAVPFALVALLLGVRRAGFLVVGIGLGFAAFLAVEALVPTALVGLLPAWTVGPWLLLQAGICLVLARLAATRP